MTDQDESEFEVFPSIEWTRSKWEDPLHEELEVESVYKCTVSEMQEKRALLSCEYDSEREREGRVQGLGRPLPHSLGPRGKTFDEKEVRMGGDYVLAGTSSPVCKEAALEAFTAEVDLGGPDAEGYETPLDYLNGEKDAIREELEILLGEFP
jgi:hypothetical protein